MITAKDRNFQRLTKQNISYYMMQHMLTTAWFTIATQGPRLRVPSCPCSHGYRSQRDENREPARSPQTSLSKASHTATSNFSGDRMCSSAMSLKEDPFVDLDAFSTASSQGLVFRWIGGQGEDIDFQGPCGQGQRWPSVLPTL